MKKIMTYETDVCDFCKEREANAGECVGCGKVFCDFCRDGNSKMVDFHQYDSSSERMERLCNECYEKLDIGIKNILKEFEQYREDEKQIWKQFRLRGRELNKKMQDRLHELKAQGIKIGHQN